MTVTAAPDLATALADHRAAGRKLLVPYVTGGMDDQWLVTVEALAGAGADAIEIGLPFSDPMIDGPTVQAASLAALERGTTPAGVLADLGRISPGVPLVVMTYYNLVIRTGHRRMASSLAASGVTGAIVPDLPLEEVGPWADAADAAGVATVLLVAPSTPDERMAAIVERCRGFVYTVGRMGVTGEQRQLAGTALDVAARVKAATSLPVCVGIGISDADQARQVCEVADVVIVGSALVRRLLEGGGVEAAVDFIGGIRRAIDAG